MRQTLLAALLLAPALLHAQDQTVWHFDRLDEVAGHKTIVEGHPVLVDTPAGRAIHFNGREDALFLPVHPLAGAATWTWEMVFRPDPDGAPEQRVFHLQAVDAAGADVANMRQLFEIRIRAIPGSGEKGWCLDSHARASAQPAEMLTLLDCAPAHMHSFGGFHTATATYDGTTMRSYVDGVLQAEGTVKLAPQMPGHSSLGTRINRTYYFKGTVLEARFTRHVLPVNAFLKHP
jgi:hypothetical protein